MLNKKFIIITLFIISLLANVVLGFLLANTIYANDRATQSQQVNLKVLSFTDLFIEKVLMSSQDVSFDTRLTLETMVRNLNDPDILSQWEKFTNAKDNQTASVEAKNLLHLLVKKILY